MPTFPRKAAPSYAEESGYRKLNAPERIMIMAGLFVLAAEWLLPLKQMPQITDLYVIQPFLWLTAIFLFMDLWKMPGQAEWPIKIALCLGFVVYLFGYSLTDPAAWRHLGAVVWKDGESLLQGKPELLSAETRTFMFMLGVSLLLSVVQSLVLEKQRIFWLMSATIFYLVLLQIWPGIDTSPGLVRASASGLILLSLLRLPRLERIHRIPEGRKSWSPRWLASTLLFVGGAVAAGVFISGVGGDGAKPDLQRFADLPALWPYSSSAATASDSAQYTGVSHQSGWSLDDSRLGGSLSLDAHTVFIAKTPSLTYWRGEAKSVYTGLGWKESRNDLLQTSLDADLSQAAGQADGTSGMGNTITQEIMLERPSSALPLFSGGTIRRVDAVYDSSGVPLAAGHLLIDRLENKVTLQPDQPPAAYYKLETELPKSGPDVLRKSTGEMPDWIAAVNLQLPAELPERVVRLAQTVTAQENNQYDKVVAVEQFLKSNYTYNLSGNGVPQADEDFADRFLFTDKKGYCDHFSTAMTVMLRSVHIPARWVKGFAPGEPVDTAGNDAATAVQGAAFTVNVKNLDAHSWVEVYFPSVGWVPFDPTPGYSDFSGKTARASGISAAGSSGRAVQTANSPLNQNQLSAGKAKTPANTVSTIMHYMTQYGLQAKERLMALSFDTHKIKLAAGAVMLSLFTLLLIKSLWGHDIALQDAIFRYRRAEGGNQRLRALEKVWKRIFRRYGPIGHEQTYREYISALQTNDEQKRLALSEFVLFYEAVRYGRNDGRLSDMKKLGTILEKIFK